MRVGFACAIAIACATCAACAGSPDGGATRGTGWRDGGGDAPDASGPVGGGATKAPPVPNVDAVRRGECATASAPSRLLPANLLFTLDRSSSMACNLPPTTDSVDCELDPTRTKAGEPSKWEITRGELVDAIALLPAQAVVGLSYFSNDDACGVHSTPSVPLAPLGRAQTSLIEASLAAVTPGGSTPLVGATVLAYKHLHTEAVAGRITGRRFVVLITDGEQSESCSNPTRCEGQAECTRLLVDEEVPKAAAAGIGIFVIGAPGSEPARVALSEIARAGGTAPDACAPERGDCHFDMTREPDFGRGLRQALSDIAGRAVRCEFPVPTFDGMKIDLDRINIVYTPGEGERRVIVRDDRAACDDGADGWQYTEDEAGIRLCGPACEEVRGDPAAELDVVLGCPVIVPI
jgi:hypothetical protein